MYLPYQSFKQVITKWIDNYFLNWIKNTLLFTYSTNILVRLLTVNVKTFITQKSENVWPDYSQSSRENATPSSGTSPSASCKELPFPRGREGVLFAVRRVMLSFVACEVRDVSQTHQ